jgi:thiol:disulfide interchange protein DsbC
MRIYLILALLAISLSTLADEKTTEANEKTTEANEKTTEKTTPFSTSTPKIPRAVRKTARTLLGDEAAKTVAPTPIRGLYEVVVGNEDVLYISRDGRYIVAGSLFEAETRKNLTDERRAQLREAQNPARMKAINAVDEKEMVVFAPEGKVKHTINVFTDVDCGYCAKFHREVPELNEAGIKVRYLAFPRAGVDSATYKKMVSVWCASNRQQAITDAKARREIKQVTCKNPVKDQLSLGQKLGVTGTPAMVLSDGQLVPGYLSADKLIPWLDEKFPPN